MPKPSQANTSHKGSCMSHGRLCWHGVWQWISDGEKMIEKRGIHQYQMKRLIAVNASPGWCLKAGIIWGNPQYMSWGRRWPNDNDYLGNEWFLGRSCMAEQTWGFSVMSCGGVDNGIFDNWCHCAIHCQLRRVKVSTVNGLKTNNILLV